MVKSILKKRVPFLLAAVIAFTLSFVVGCSNLDESVKGNILEVVKKEKWTEIGKDIFVFTGDFYLVNMVLVTSGKDAVLIDTGMYETEYRNVMDFMNDKELKLKNIIITHMHEDHVTNLEKFKTEDIVPITPENAENNQVIKVGNKNLRIIFTEGHYKAQGHISVEIEDENVLIAGDVICNNIIPPIAAGGEIDELLKTLKILEKKNYSVIIPGHGEVVENELLFKRQFEYLNNAKSKVEEVIQNGGEMSDLDDIKLTDCIEDTSYLYELRLNYLHKRSLETIYQQLTK